MVVTVHNLDENLYLGVNESYSLWINETDLKLEAETIYGALNGLKTFAQLVQWHKEGLIIPFTPIVVHDKPRFPWRGLMVDTSRHFLPVSVLENLIDSISYVKLNVFHWHLTDAESISLELKSHPELTKKGAWHPDVYYSHDDIKHILTYAKERGIRVVPEVDTPGHTYSFGKAYPEMIVNCSKAINGTTRYNRYPGINNVALNVTNEDIYPILKDVYQEVATIFDDEYMHIGGDEVYEKCYNEFRDYFEEWRRKNNIPDHKAMINYFRLKLTPSIVESKKKMVVWQEALDEVYGIPTNPLTNENTVVHVWKKEGWQNAVKQSLERGYKTILSGGWYLDQFRPGDRDHYLFIDTWEDFYSVEPLEGIDNEELEKLFLGGEVCQWGEAVNSWSIESTIWPRAASTAERLWSTRHTTDEDKAYHRLTRLTCYLNRNGVRSNPIRPNFCYPIAKKSLYAGGLTLSVPAWAAVIVLATVVSLAIALGVMIRKYKNRTTTYDTLD